MLKRLSLYTLLLCFVPIFTIAIGWQWQENMDLTYFDYLLYLVTETGSFPYAIVTCVFFALIYFFVIPNKKQAILVIMIMAFSILLTQGIKSALKTVFAEPRPFVSAIAENSPILTDYFYEQSKAQRAEIVEQYYRVSRLEKTPSWLIHHRAKETGYSFPSGHTMFAVTWVLLAAGFSILLGKKIPLLRWGTFIISLWALLMLISRLRLGMHYPIDLITSSVISWIIHIGLFSLLSKKKIFNK